MQATDMIIKIKFVQDGQKISATKHQIYSRFMALCSQLILVINGHV